MDNFEVLKLQILGEKKYFEEQNLHFDTVQSTSTKKIQINEIEIKHSIEYAMTFILFAFIFTYYLLFLFIC